MTPGHVPPPQVWAAARRFVSGDTPLDLREYGSGNINDTFLVTARHAPWRPLLLQRLNPRVFPRPDLVMANFRTCGRHLKERLGAVALPPGRRFEVPELLPTLAGEDWYIDESGGWWRALGFIAGTHSLDQVRDTAAAREVGWALGLFHFLLSPLPPAALADTLPGFHLAPLYLRRYDEVCSRRRLPATPEVRYARA